MLSKFGYIAPNIVTTFLFGPIVLIQGVYAKYFGISLADIALVLLISRFFDAITDPFIGYLSDYYYSRTGSFRPFVVVGAILLLVGCYLLYIPIEANRAYANSYSVGIEYFLGCFILVYLSFTLFEIPHLAWGRKLGDGPAEVTRIYGLRAMSTSLGGLLFFTIPLLPYFDTNEITPVTLQFVVLVAALLIGPSLYFCIKWTPKANSRKTFHNHKNTQERKLTVLSKEIIKNKPFLRFIFAFFLVGMGAFGMWLALMFIFIDSFLGLGEDFALANVLGTIAGVFTFGFWRNIADRFSSTVAWSLGVFLLAISILGVATLEPGNSSIFLFYLSIISVYIGSMSFNVNSPSLLSNIIDYSTWKFGIERNATYFSIYTFMLKSSASLGGALALAIASWYGFDPSKNFEIEGATFGLRLATCWLPVLLLFFAIALVYGSPIDQRRHHMILKRLATRHLRVAERFEQTNRPISTL